MPTAQDTDSLARELIRWMEVPQHQGVYALGNFGRQVTFASQQTRAFNLIWALFRANRLATGQRVGVVGAGLAGMTAAVAALAKGCEVHLYEQASQTCPIQRGNDIRFIHPNILRWPDPVSETTQTDFPLLNWTAANVRGVIKQLDIQWGTHESNPQLKRFFNYKLNRVFVAKDKNGPLRPWLSANRQVDGPAGGDPQPGFVEEPYDAVVLAVGFGEERPLAGVPFLSYWENDSLHQETGRGRRAILVSGCGDGGLIDALRLRLRNFDHADFVHRFLRVAQADSLIQQLNLIERDLRPHAGAPDISLRLQSRYAAVLIPDDVRNYFVREKRMDTAVTLNGPDAGPLSFKASLLNRFAAFLAMRYADLHYLSGYVTAEPEAGRFKVVVTRNGAGPETYRFDGVIIRHGPRSAIRDLISPAAADELERWWGANKDITIDRHWVGEGPGDPHQFFGGVRAENAPPNELMTDLALACFEAAHRHYSATSKVIAVAVKARKPEEKAGYVVTLKPGIEPPRESEFAGVPVQFVQAPVQTSPASPTTLPGKRAVPIGAGIYNFDAQQRWREKYRSASDPVAWDRGETTYNTVGTLGCFARDASNKMHLVSVNHVLLPDDLGQAGDRIYLEGQSPPTAQPIAMLARWVPIQPVLPNLINLAAAELEPDVHPDFGPLIETKSELLRVGTVEDKTLPRDVMKIGRTSGITRGRIKAILDVLTVTNPGIGLVTFRDVLEIESQGTGDFSSPGDGGAVVIQTNGMAVGIIIAGMSSENVQISFACQLQPGLDELKLTLLPSPPAPPPIESGKKSQPGARPGRRKRLGGGNRFGRVKHPSDNRHPSEDQNVPRKPARHSVPGKVETRHIPCSYPLTSGSRCAILGL